MPTSKRHVVFVEPRFTERSAQIWAIRGGYKYGSIIGDLHKRAAVTIAMSVLPPTDDVHRLRLQNEFGVNFVGFDSADVATPAMADELAGDLTALFEQIRPTTVSNLNGRSVGYCYASAKAARRIGASYVMRVAGNDIETRAKNAESRNQPFIGTPIHIGTLRQERIAAQLSDSIIVMSNREKARVASFCHEPGKIHVCFRGADQSHFRPSDTPASICRKFLFVGRQSYEKGYDILEEATDRLAEGGFDGTVSFAGTFQPSASGIRVYVGFVNYADLPTVYREHDALVLCSRSEGFPQVVMEAMSCGLPCILTRHLFEKEFRDEIDCLLVEPEAAAVAAAIQRLRDDEALYRRLRAASLSIAAARFSEEDNRRYFESVLLGNPAARPDVG